MEHRELTFIEASRVTARLPVGSSRLRVEIEADQCVPAAVLRRVFPLSNEGGYVSIQTESGSEIGIIRNLNGMDAESKELIEANLDRRYFSPAIERITGLKADAGMWKFEVDTTRGRSEFYVRNWRDSAHEVSPGRWLLQSVDGQRYEIRRLEALDARSRNLLDQLL